MIRSRAPALDIEGNASFVRIHFETLPIARRELAPELEFSGVFYLTLL
jgi:hypothetical protein